MSGELDEQKKPRRHRRSLPPGLPSVPREGRGAGIRSLILYILAYGGMVAVAVTLVFALRGGEEVKAPAVPLSASAGDLANTSPNALVSGGRRGAELEARQETASARPADVSQEVPVQADVAQAPGATTRPASAAPVSDPVDPADDEAEPAGGVVVASPDEALEPPVAVVRPEPAPEMAPEPEPEPKEVDDGCRRYPVLPGDATRTIARRLKIRRADLRKWNPELSSRGPKRGEKLRICGSKKSVVEWKERHVTVGRGDTVLRIARKFGLSIENVAKANDIDPNHIEVGQELLVFEAVWR